MNERYWVEELEQVGPDDADWIMQDSFDDPDTAQSDAQSRIKPTEHGDSGVRVFDTEEQKIIWTNC